MNLLGPEMVSDLVSLISEPRLMTLSMCLYSKAPTPITSFPTST
jgi:hypothetical protein